MLRFCTRRFVTIARPFPRAPLRFYARKAWGLDENDDVPTEKKTRKRAVKTDPAILETKDNTQKPEVVKRPRGRPRKNPLPPPEPETPTQDDSVSLEHDSTIELSVEDKMNGPVLRTDEEYEYENFDKSINKGEVPSKLSNLKIFDDYNIGDCYSYFAHETIKTEDVDAAIKMSTDMIESNEKLENDLEPLPKKILGLICRGLIHHLLLNEQDYALKDFQHLITLLEENANQVPKKLFAFAHACEAFSLSASMDLSDPDPQKKFKVLEGLNTALKIAPEFDETRFKRILFVNKSNFNQSLDDCNVLIKANRDPWAAFGLYHRGVLSMARDIFDGDQEPKDLLEQDNMRVYQRAIDDFSNCLKKKPDMLEAERDLSSLYITVGDYQNGIKHLDSLIEGLKKKNISFASALFSRALLKANLGDNESSFEDLDEVFRIEPSFVDVYQRIQQEAMKDFMNGQDEQ
ncbi:hypothetical protein AKO1_015819 [Acrasis kona]|uniref:Uncharacterized protein n=1 Tax=Acrasis kona TaxID=1008807 RepID=A0AAW2ZJF5_9EUKA